MQDNSASLRSAKLYKGLALVSLLFLFGFVLTRTAGPIFDEAHCLAETYLFKERASFSAWLVNNVNSTPGPTAALMHLALTGGDGHLPTPWFRLPNLVLLLVVGFCVYATLTLNGIPRARATLVSCSMIGIPISWVVSGMALTEIPAMAGLAFSLLGATLIGGSSRADFWLKRVAYVLLFAVGVTIALCGRQNYVVVLPFVVLLACSGRYQIKWTAVAVALGILAPLILFFLWGGLTPPGLTYVGEGTLVVRHAGMAFCYAGLVCLFLAPRILSLHGIWPIILGLSLGIINALFGIIDFLPMASVQKLVPSPSVLALVRVFFNAAFVFSGVSVMLTLLYELWVNPSRSTLACLCAIIALCAMCAGVTAQFSTRYVALAIPFFLLLMQPYMDFGLWALLRLALGSALGALSLISYYMFN